MEAIKTTETRVSPLFQVIWYSISFVIFTILIYRTASVFTVYDPAPGFVGPDKAELAISGKHTISLGLYIRDFVGFDLIKNEITFDGIISASFNAHDSSLADVGKFSFEKGEIIRQSDPYTTVVNNITYAFWDIRVRLTADFNYRGYPIDNHRVYIVVTNYALAPFVSEFIVEPNNFELAPHIELAAWDIINKDSITGYMCEPLRFGPEKTAVCFPRAVFTLDCKRHDLNHLLSILLPLLLIFFVTLVSFSFNVQEFFEAHLVIAIGAITALLAYRFVIQAMSPDVGYFMLSDYLFLLFLLAVFAAFFINTTIQGMSLGIKKILVIALHALVIMGSGIILYAIVGAV